VKGKEEKRFNAEGAEETENKRKQEAKKGPGRSLVGMIYETAFLH
jgi:hypothetical protein